MSGLEMPRMQLSAIRAFGGHNRPDASNDMRRVRRAPSRRAAQDTEVSDIHSCFAVSRRYGEIVEALVKDQGGADNLSEARLQLVRRFAAYAFLAEQMEAGLMRGDEINVSEHTLVCKMLVQLSQSIGLDRKSHRGMPTLADMLHSQ